MSTENICNDDSLDQSKAKNARDVLKGIIVSESNLETYLIAVAVHKDSSKNFINRISCKKGIPLDGYVYDAQSDSYFIECTDFLHVGVIPVSFVATAKDSYFWKMNIPLPEVVIKKYLTEIQKKDLKNFKSHFSSQDYMINYVQMVNPN